jgi:hypothetical protein
MNSKDPSEARLLAVFGRCVEGVFDRKIQAQAVLL